MKPAHVFLLIMPIICLVESIILKAIVFSKPASKCYSKPDLLQQIIFSHQGKVHYRIYTESSHPN
jgi:hypothetical protein